MEEQMTKPDRTDYFLTATVVLVRGSLVALALVAMVFGNWMLVFESLMVFTLTFAANVVEKRYKINIPLELEIYIVLFIFASIFLGETRGFYTRFWWWDGLLHFSSAMVFGFIGFLVLYVLHYQKKLQTSPFIIAVFTFSFGVAIGALWEVFEFLMDQGFGLNMQRSGLDDTMRDTMVNGMGALIASGVGYAYMKKQELGVLRRVIKKFLSQNPRFARRSKTR